MVQKSVLLFISGGDFTGGQKVAFGYAAAFVRDGYRVVAITGLPPENGATGVAEMLRQTGVIVFEEDGFNNTFDVGLIVRCACVARMHRPDYLVSFLQGDFKVAAVVSVVSRIPLIALLQNVPMFWGSAVAKWLKRRLFELLLRAVPRKIFGISAFVLKRYSKEFSIPSGKLELAQNGIELGRYAPGGPAADLGRAEGVLRLLNIGRIDRQKGQIFLVEAVSLLDKAPEVRLFLAGEPDPKSPDTKYAADVRRMAGSADLEGKVEFLGWRSDVAELLRACDVYVHAALWEGAPLPLAVMEAMAVEKPVILTDCCEGEMGGFVHGTHGLIVPAGNAAALANAVREMRSLSKSRMEEMGRMARRLIEENFDSAKAEARFISRCGALIYGADDGVKKANPKVEEKNVQSLC